MSYTPEPASDAPIDYRERNLELFTARRNVIVELCGVIGRPDGTTVTPSVLLKDVHDRVAALDDADRFMVNALLRQIEQLTETIVLTNYGLVRDYVSRFSRGSRDSVEDFEGAGMVGLMQAIDTYDPAQGPFGQWAFRPVKRSVLKAVRDSDHPNLSPGDFERRPDILRAKAALISENEDEPNPSYEAIAARSGATLEQVRRVLEPVNVSSLSAPVGERGESDLSDLIADETVNLEDAVLAKVAIEALEMHGLPVLSARELFVLCRRFGIDGEPEAKLSAIGFVLGLSREAVRNVESKALARLGHPATIRQILRAGRK